ncbi:thioredoxin [Candidatus Bathyarchaeota archaeon]|nr:thioredoxin [Candidatus Bathyarchaeota archaeon]
MGGEEDKELERIRQRKIEELVRKSRMENSVNEPIEITDQNFSDIVRSRRLVVIDCWAPWCAPCRMMAPVIDELAREYAGKILFGKLNVDENPRVPAEYQIMSIPTFLIFKNGILVERIVGAMPKKLLEQRIIKYIE